MLQAIHAETLINTTCIISASSVIIAHNCLSDDPTLKDCEIVLQGFVPILDYAKDEVIFIKIKLEDKTLIYHLTSHPDSHKALH